MAPWSEAAPETAGLRGFLWEDRETREYHWTATPGPGEDPLALVRRLCTALRNSGARVIKQDVFGCLGARNCVENLQKALLGDVDWPLTWVDGESAAAGAFSGIYLFAISGPEVETIRLKERIVGRSFTAGGVRHCFLGDVTPPDPAESRSAQAEAVYEEMEAALGRAGMDLGHLIRTWLYVDRILEWYASLNLVRTGLFRRKDLPRGVLPASTGVAGRSVAGAALTAAAWAVASADPGILSPVPSPLQCPAPEYGSSFSRAVRISTPDRRQLLVSGTASLGLRGETLHADRISDQIARSMEVLEQLLDSQNMSLRDVTRSTGYFRDVRHAALLSDWCRNRDLPVLPLIPVQTRLCREDLLFELELDASTADARGVPREPASFQGESPSPSR